MLAGSGSKMAAMVRAGKKQASPAPTPAQLQLFCKVKKNYNVKCIQLWKLLKVKYVYES